MQIILGIFTIIIIAALIFSRSQTVFTQKRWTIAKIIIFVILLLWIYEITVDSKADSNREIVLHFNHGKEIICDENSITLKNFYYENGTESFVAKDQNRSLRGIIYPISRCEIKK